MEIVHYLQITVLISCCYANFVKPPHLQIFRPQLLLGPIYKPVMNGHLTKPSFLQPIPLMFPSPKPFFKVLPVVKPVFLMKPKPFFKKMKPIVMKTVKYKKPKIPLKPRIPFRYLRPNPRPMYRLPLPVFRRNVLIGYRQPPTTNRPTPRVRRLPTRIYRRPSFRPPTIFRPPSQLPRTLPPQTAPQLPVRTYEPPVQPPVVNIRPVTRLPAKPDTPLPTPSVVNPPLSEFSEPRIIPEQRRMQWLQAAHGGMNYPDDDDDDNDDFDDYWEDKFEEFDGGLEDELEKKDDGYYDNDGDDIIDDEIFENYDRMDAVQTNIARSRKYMDDLTENNNNYRDITENNKKYREKYFGKADTRLTQQTQQVTSRRVTPNQPSTRMGDLIERRNKYQEKYFEKAGNRLTQQTQQVYPINLSVHSSKGMGETTEMGNKYQENYFEKAANRILQQAQYQQAGGTGERLTQQAYQADTNNFGHLANDRNNYLDRKGGRSISRHAQQLHESHIPAETKNNLRRRGNERNKYDEKYFEMKGDNLSQQKYQQVAKRAQQTNSKGDLIKYNGIGDSISQQLHQLERGNMQIQHTNSVTRKSTRIASQHINFSDNNANVKSEEVIKYRNNNKKYLDNQENFSKTYVSNLAQTQNKYDSRKENNIFERTFIPNEARFELLKS